MTPTLPVAICLILGTAFLSAQDPAAPPPPAAPLLVRPDPATPPPAIERPLAGETQPAPARTPVPPPVSIEIPSENSLTSETRRVGDHTLTIGQVAPVDLAPPPLPVAAPPPHPP
ncbi:MAG: hypothetical protein K9M97_13955, partial [Akkermansiaceae bacterium]|nr:hypothetical protein [Akkermansiaceae bacterium]